MYRDTAQLKSVAHARRRHQLKSELLEGYEGTNPFAHNKIIDGTGSIIPTHGYHERAVIIPA